MVTAGSIRRGASKLGCLFGIVILGAVGYFGVQIGGWYWKNYQFQDAMRSEARFAANRTDDMIKQHLQAVVDSLGLPPAAKDIRVRRANNVIFIYTSYLVQIEFPGFVREINFAPEAQSPF